jgi:hypothetical protein
MLNEKHSIYHEGSKTQRKIIYNKQITMNKQYTIYKLQNKPKKLK